MLWFLLFHSYTILNHIDKNLRKRRYQTWSSPFIHNKDAQYNQIHELSGHATCFSDTFFSHSRKASSYYQEIHDSDWWTFVSQIKLELIDIPLLPCVFQTKIHALVTNIEPVHHTHTHMIVCLYAILFEHRIRVCTNMWQK